MNLFKKIKDKLFDKVSGLKSRDDYSTESDTVIFHNGEYYYYDGEKISDLELKENRLYNATKFHYYNKQSLTKRFLKSLSPGELFSLSEPSYCIYMCVMRNNKLRYILVEGEGKEEIFIDDIMED